MAVIAPDDHTDPILATLASPATPLMVEYKFGKLLSESRMSCGCFTLPWSPSGCLDLAWSFSPSPWASCYSLGLASPNPLAQYFSPFQLGPWVAAPKCRMPHWLPSVASYLPFIKTQVSQLKYKFKQPWNLNDLLLWESQQRSFLLQD